MSKILTTFTINEYLISEATRIMYNSNYTEEEKQEYYKQLKFVKDHIKEIMKDIHTCTCDECFAWERYIGEKEAFSADGGYLGFCHLWQDNTQEGDFCSESRIKIAP